MTIKLLKPVDANGKIIPAGAVIKINSPEVSERIIREGIGIPSDPSDVMTDILRETRDDIQADGVWKATAEVREIEDEIDKIYVEVLAGSKTIDDFQAACLRWKIAGTQVRRDNV